MANDAARAYVNEPSTLSVFVDLCEEYRLVERRSLWKTLGIDVRHEICSKTLSEKLHRLNTVFRVTRGST